MQAFASNKVHDIYLNEVLGLKIMLSVFEKAEDILRRRLLNFLVFPDSQHYVQNLFLNVRFLITERL